MAAQLYWATLKGVGMPIAAGISIFGISVNPALFAFGLVIGAWGLLNLLEYRRFD